MSLSESTTMDVKGRRLLVISRNNEGSNFSASNIKRLTGGDSIPVRTLTGKNMIAGHKPEEQAA